MSRKKKILLISVCLISVFVFIYWNWIYSVNRAREAGKEFITQNGGYYDSEEREWIINSPIIFQKTLNKMFGHKVTVISITGVESLKEIECFKEVEVLSLSDCQVKDFSPLLNLRKVRIAITCTYWYLSVAYITIQILSLTVH